VNNTADRRKGIGELEKKTQRERGEAARKN
jgi:hypothetical protein